MVPSPAATDPNAVVPSDAALRRESPAMVKPTLMLSEKVLDDPRSWKAKKALSGLVADEQMIQLCSIEAMAQVGSWKKTLQPDLLVAYAMADTKISGNSLLADDAAFHSRQQWYNIKFKCDLAPDHRKVASFEFLVGDAVLERSGKVTICPPTVVLPIKWHGVGAS
jgi:hypothetical protein